MMGDDIVESPEALAAAVDRLVALLHTRIGLRADPGLPGRLRRAIRDGALHASQDYARYVDTVSAGNESLQALLNRITVQETAFFRHPQHFEVLARDVLPTLPQPVKIWSAACSNGQEAYSLAMLLKEQGISGSVVATDLSTAALRRTADARYSGRELSGLSPARMSAHLTPSGDGWEINRSLRDRVTTFRHNLIDPLPAAVASAQVILCRNVLIYLSPEHARAFLDRVADSYPPQTTLFLGAAETIWQITDRLEAIPIRDTFLYRRRSTHQSTPPSEAGPRRVDRRVATAPRRQADPDAAVEIAARRQPALLPAHGSARSSGLALSSSHPGEEAEGPLAAALLSLANAALIAGDHEAAIVAFRKCVYLDPHDPVAHLHLGLALEAAGQASSARRAYTAARAALAEGGTDQPYAGIKGFAVGELVRLLDSKLKVQTP
jgi:chemotaxis methyl-accepting protein methylase